MKMYPVVASSAEKLPKKPVMAAYECVSCTHQFAFAVEASIAANVKRPFCVKCGHDELKPIKGVTFAKLKEESTKICECSSCKVLNLVPSAVLAMPAHRNGDAVNIHCAACGEDLNFEFPEDVEASDFGADADDGDLGGDVLDDEELILEESESAEEVEEELEEAAFGEEEETFEEESSADEDEDDEETASADEDEDDAEECAGADNLTDPPSSDEIEYEEGEDTADEFSDDVGPGPLNGVDEQEKMADKKDSSKDGKLPSEVSRAKKAKKVKKKVKAELEAPGKTTNEHPDKTNPSADRYGEKKGLTEIKEKTDDKLKNDSPDLNAQPKAGDLRESPEQKIPPATFAMNLDQLVSGEATFARLNDDTIACFKGDVIVAGLSRGDRTVEDHVFSSLNFMNSMKLSLAKNGLDATLSSYKFDRTQVQISEKIVTQAAVTAAVEKAQREAKAELAASKDEVAHAIKIALAGINRGFFAKKSNSLAQTLSRRLKSAGFQRAEAVVEASFRDSHDEFAAVITEVAMDLLNKPIAMRNEYAKAIGQTEYVVSEAEDEDDEADKEEASVLESSLKQPVVASIEETPAGQKKSITNIAAANGGSLFRR